MGIDDILARRLLVKDSAQDSLYIQFLELSRAALDLETTAENCKLNWENFIVGVATCQLGLQKLKVTCDTIERQAAEFGQLKVDLRNKIELGEKEITKLQETLEEERAKRQNKEEYDSICSIVTKYPSRKESAAEIEQLELEIQKLEQESQDLDDKMQLRAKQFHLVLFGIGELCKQFEVDPAAKSIKSTKKRKQTPSRGPSSKRRKLDRPEGQ